MVEHIVRNSTARMLHGCLLHGTTSSHDARCPFSGPFHFQPVDSGHELLTLRSDLDTFRFSNQPYDPVSFHVRQRLQEVHLGSSTQDHTALSPLPRPAGLLRLHGPRTPTDRSATAHRPSASVHGPGHITTMHDLQPWRAHDAQPYDEGASRICDWCVTRRDCTLPCHSHLFNSRETENPCNDLSQYRHFPCDVPWTSHSLVQPFHPADIPTSVHSHHSFGTGPHDDLDGEIGRAHV